MQKISKPCISLSIVGFRRAVKAETGTVKKFDWGNAIADALILSALTFFTGLGGTAAMGVPTLNAVAAAAISAASQFTLILAMKRNLVKERC